MLKLTIRQVAEILDGTVVGNENIEVQNISSIENGVPNTISFLSNPKYEKFIYETAASAVIVNENFEPKKEIKTSLIKVKDAYSSFTQLLEEYQRLTALTKEGIESQSHISKSATYDENIYVGAFAYIGENVKIGKNVKIYPHVYIGDNVTIGNNSVLFSGVKIYANCKIGNYCTAHAGAVIGSDGFGFAPQKDGSYKKIPQLGNVVLEDYVDIGANTVIDCGTFEATTIQKGVKIDNLVQIAHNVEIGENTVIASQAGVSGSTKIGKQVILAGQVGVVGHIKVGDGVIVTAQSGISKDVPAGSTYFGSPAFEKNEYIKSVVIFRKLPEMMKRIASLEKKVLDL